MKKLAIISIAFLLSLGFLSGCGTDANNGADFYSAEIEFRFVGGELATRANGDYIAIVRNNESNIPGNPEVVNIDFTDYNFNIGRAFLPVSGVTYQVDLELVSQNRYSALRIFQL